MTKKVPKKILRIGRKFFVNLRKKCFWPPTPRRRRRQFFWTGGAPPPPTEIDRRAAADTKTSAHSSSLKTPTQINIRFRQIVVAAVLRHLRHHFVFVPADSCGTSSFSSV